MFKYAVILTKGNEETILGLFDTKPEADRFGKTREIPRSKGLVGCSYIEVDEAGNRVNSRERFYGIYN